VAPNRWRRWIVALIVAGGLVPLGLPRARVLDVKRAPGSCAAYPPGSVPDDEYVAVVRLYTLFRIPARTFTVACGGHLI
jgi:hypothetical protein